MQEKRQFSNQLVNFARTLVFLVGVVMRRKIIVSLTIIVVSGITSDVGERSSVRSDGICQRKGKLDYTRLSVKKKRIKKHTDRAKYFNLLRVLAQSILSTSHKPLSSTHRELKQSPLSFAILGSRNKRPKQLEIREHR